MTGRSSKTARKSLFFSLSILFFAILSIALLFFFESGFVINRITHSSFNAEHIHVQFYGGIIVTVDRLAINERQTADPVSNPEFFISRFNTLAFLFKEIRVDNILYQDNVYHLKFTDNLFTISGDKFQLASTLTYTEGKILLNISRLELKPYPGMISGIVTYEKAAEKMTFSGEFKGPKVSGQLKFSKFEDHFEAEINTGQFFDLAGILAAFPLPPELLSWLAESVTASEYRIDQLRLSIPFKDGKPDIQSDSISGKAIAKNAAVIFDTSLPPVLSKEVRVTLENDRLFFDLIEPEYKQKSIAGSSVSIEPLIIGDTYMNINIQTDTLLDREIHTLLEAYDIRLPFMQEEGTTQADLHLIFDLPGFTLHTNGSFTTDAGKWSWGDVSFQTDGAIVHLQDDLIKIEKAEIAYKDMVQASMKGSVDISKKQAALTTDIMHLNFKDGGKDILKAQDLTTPIKIDFCGNDVKINLMELQTNITLSPTQKLVNLDNLNKVKPYVIPLQKFPFQEGMININLTDPAQLTFDGLIQTTALPLSFNDKPVTRFAFQGNKNKDEFNISINDGKITLKVKDKVIVRLHDYLVTIDTDATGNMMGPTLPTPVLITGPACHIKSKKIYIPARNFQAELVGGKITFTADVGQGRVFFESEKEGMTVEASDIDTRIVQNFFEHADLHDGRFNILFKRKDENNHEGHLEFSNILIKNLALLNNVIAFLNAVPALATLSSPGFNRDGYYINEGLLHFSNNNRVFTVHQFQTEGETVNLEAEGWVDFNNNNLDLNVKLIGLKDYSKIVGKIPLAGYAILGNDGSISTSLDITGSRGNPEIKTNLAKDIGMTPIRILKRTLKWPFRTLKKLGELINQPEKEECPDCDMAK